MNRKKIGIVGVGNVGSNLAFLLATNKVCDEILLKDIREDFAKAVALDISQAVCDKNVTVNACDGEDFKDCNIVVITAGIARKPNMSREELLLTNAKILSLVFDEILENNKNAIYIVVSNPLDAMVYAALKRTKLPKNRVFGMAGVLDSARFRYYIAEALDFKFKDIKALVIGSHSNSMLPLVNHSFVDGKKLSDIFSKEKLDEIVNDTKNGGAKIVELFKTSSAYFAPAHSIFLMCKAIIDDTKEIFACCYMLENEYNCNDITMGVPVVLGKNGVESVVKLDLDGSELELLKESSKTVENSIEIIKKEFL